MQTLPVGQSSGSAATSAARGLGQLDSEDFFKILVTELQSQDPFEPTKTADMIGQVSQIRTIELNTQLSTTLAQMARQQRTAGASELIGKYVAAVITNADGSQQAIQGVVTGVRFGADGAAVLELDTGEAVLAAQVTYVTTVEAAELHAQSDSESAASKDGAASRRKDAGKPPTWLALDGSIHL